MLFCLARLHARRNWCAKTEVLDSSDLIFSHVFESCLNSDNESFFSFAGGSGPCQSGEVPFGTKASGGRSGSC